MLLSRMGGDGWQRASWLPRHATGPGRALPGLQSRRPDVSGSYTPYAHDTPQVIGHDGGVTTPYSPSTTAGTTATGPRPGLAQTGAGAGTASCPRAEARRPFPGTEQLRPAEVFAGPGYQAPRARTSPLAVTALVLALLSFVPALGLIAAAIGALALSTMRHRYETGQSLAWFAIIVGLASCVAWLALMLLVSA